MPRIAMALNAFGGVAVLSAVVFLGGSFYVHNDVGRAFCLGAFFSGLIGSILLFGFAKVIGLLDELRERDAEGLGARQQPPRRDAHTSTGRSEAEAKSAGGRLDAP